MEGLIPLVYKRIKRGVTHRHYKCLSTTGGNDFYNSDDGGERPDLRKYYRSPSIPDSRRVSDRGLGRRSSSLPRTRPAQEKTVGFDPNHHDFYLYKDQDSTREREMVRFRTHRRMFSCITG